ncbi:MAG: hypothetical protein ABI587_02060 [Gemmatimonadales bacterium]
MDILLLTLRLVHIVAGSLWVGFAVFVSFMLSPAIEDVGPAAAEIMPALGRRGIMTVLPALALATVLSGFGLYWRIAGGALGVFLQTRTGGALALSGLAAVVAYLVGILVTRPAMMGAVRILHGLAGASVEDRARQLAVAGELRSRGARAGRFGAALLLAAATGMAEARYL